ncbi:hypothetical protein N9043_00300 [bacterium]|nr:hypothetical protein [bacterium]
MNETFNKELADKAVKFHGLKEGDPVMVNGYKFKVNAFNMSGRGESYIEVKHLDNAQTYRFKPEEVEMYGEV